ncbi:AraC family transcriptional regulator [Geothrix sp. 21YS21S-2]|uniref:AraC family transcriptional regulator n=1 Tax=Geothrix sp. 21YS21S-2 TaxID=3068893 RepID=UPI0027BAE3F8|nr:AraC family transcriptional regulator [Geothrix sp. 21YS21S-2]
MDTQAAAQDLARLAGLIRAHAPYDGHFKLRQPGLEVVRASRASQELAHGVAQPGICIVAQGAKKVFLGSEVFDYDASRLLVYSVDVPISGQITRASAEEPFLCLKVDLDAERVADLALRVYPAGLPQSSRNLAVCVTQADPAIIAASARLVELMARPGDAEWIAPLVVEEILIRLLRSPIGARVAQIGQEGSRVQRVAKAVSWVRMNYDRPLDVERLATLVHMSVSTFHQHFKSVTSMSPLQYQKVLRLHEARRLMLSRMMDAGTASRKVGYLSASQFSREYGRFFGNAPMRDISNIREGGMGPGLDEA